MSSRLLRVSLVLSLLAVACGRGPARGTGTLTPTATPAAVSATSTAAATEPFRVAMLVTGSRGDGSFVSARKGVQRAEQELGAEVRIVEERSRYRWEPALRRLARGDNDLVVVGTSEMTDILTRVAPDFPDQKFILFDATVDKPNVASITFAQNEGSFLAGALAACVVDGEVDDPKARKLIGVIGAEDIDVVNDFIVGYEEGAKYVDPDIAVRITYIGGGTSGGEDRARGRRLASTQFKAGARVVFGVAGGSSRGVMDAARQARRYAIGVEPSENELAPGVVLSSVLKRVDRSIFDLIQMEATGSLRTGRTYTYGIQNNGVGLDEDWYYRWYVPEECRQQVEKAKRDIASKKVRVETAFGK